MNDEQRKLLTRMIGECWHKWRNIVPEKDDGYYDYTECSKCHEKHSGSGVTIKPQRTFLTGNDMMAVKQAIEKAGKWREFANYALDKYMEERHLLETVEDSIDAMEWLIDPARFCQLAAKWAKERGWEG